MNMIERVARAIAATEYSDGHDEPWEPFVAHVRAALTAMLEPSEGMLDQGVYALDSPDYVPPYEVWRRMIQAALNEEG